MGCENLPNATLTRIISDFSGSAVVSTASVGVPPTESLLPRHFRWNNHWALSNECNGQVFNPEGIVSSSPATVLILQVFFQFCCEGAFGSGDGWAASVLS